MKTADEWVNTLDCRDHRVAVVGIDELRVLILAVQVDARRAVLPKPDEPKLNEEEE